MLKTLRTQTKTIMWVVAIAFVALIVLDWGMDIGGSRTGRGRSDAVGEVNGEQISWKEYESELSANRRMYTDRNRGAPPEYMEQILAEQTWEGLIAETLLRQEAKRLGIQVTDTDVLFQVQANPPPEVRQLPAFQTNGVFDPRKYSQALADPGLDWSWLEQYVRSYLPQQKIQERVASAVVVTDPEIRQEFARRTEEIRISYVALGPADFPSGGFSPDEASIRAYYESHTNDFMQPPRARATVARLAKRVTPGDEARARANLQEALGELANEVPFEDLAEDYSQDPSAAKGGDLGWLRRGDLREPQLENAVFALRNPGDLSQPIRGERGYHLFQLVERGGDSVHVRQILVIPKAGRQSLAELSAEAEALRAAAQTGGLSSAARAAGSSVTETGLFVQQSPPPILQSLPEAVQFCFQAKPGDVSQTYELEDALVLVQLDEARPAEPSPLSEVRSAVVERLGEGRRRERAREVAESIARQARASGDLAASARGRGLSVRQAGLFTRVAPPPELAAATSALAMSFALPAGEISPLVEDASGFYVIRVDEHKPLDEDRYRREREGILRDLLSRERQRVFMGWFQDLREKAQVVDRRAELLAPAQGEEEEEEEGATDEGESE